MTPLRIAAALAALVAVGPAWGQPPPNGCGGGCAVHGITASPGMIAMMAIEPDRSWHLVIRRYGGALEFRHSLTDAECETARLHTLGRPATDEERTLAARLNDMRQQTRRAQSAALGTPNVDIEESMITMQDVESAECFQ